MCEPITATLGTAGTIALVASAAGTVVSAAAGYMAADAQAEQARAQAKVSGYLAKDAIERGRREEQAERERIQRILGMQRAAFGASGGVVDVGSALDVLEDTAYFGELDALTIRANAEREQWFHNSNRAQLRAAAVDYQNQGYLALGATLLGGAGQLAGIANEYGAPTMPAGGPTPRSVDSFYAAPYRPEFGAGFSAPSAPRFVSSRGVRSIQ